MDTLIVYRYSVNAHYVINELNLLGIKTEINEIRKGEEVLFEIKVETADFKNARIALENITVEDSKVDENSEDYLKEYADWTKKTLVPEYYLGANFPHFIKDKSNRSVHIIYLLIIILIFGLFLIKVISNPESLKILLLMCIYLGAIIFAIWIFKKKNK